MTAQPPPRRAERPVLSAICSLVLLGCAGLAWRAAGWIGVGILGLLTVFIAVRFDLEGDRPVGPQMTPGLYASQFRDDGRADHTEAAARRSALARLAGPTQLAMLLGVLLVIVGFGALFVTEARR